MLIPKSREDPRISYALLRVANKLFELDRRTRNYGTEEPLFEAEIHMIKFIRENEGIHVTGLAELLGVTKGAVSQIVMKLQRKGMVLKEADPRNQSRLVLRLTPEGERAYRQHERLHAEFDDLVNRVLDETIEDRGALVRFLDALETSLDVQNASPLPEKGKLPPP
jgi:DNA-binding MarR family transcriptional regulator